MCQYAFVTVTDMQLNRLCVAQGNFEIDTHTGLGLLITGLGHSDWHTAARTRVWAVAERW